MAVWIRPIRLLSLVLVSGLALTSTARAADPSLVCRWTFEGNLTNSGSTGSANDGTGVNAPTYAAGQLGQALNLNGTNQYVDCGTLNLSTSGTGGITLCAWINRPAIAGDRKILGNRNGNAGFKMGVYNGANSGNTPRLEMEVWDAGGQTLTRATNGTALTSINTWYHVVCVFDDTANEVREYVNGVLDATTTGVTRSLVASTGTLRLCAEMPTANYYFSGLLDDVRIYGRVLSAAEIQGVMKGEDARSASNPSPADKAVDIPRDVVLAWTAGKSGQTHDVYFGTVAADVDAATRTNPKNVLASQAQSDATYDPTGSLAFGKTYYWRVDEVNQTPDSTIFKGLVWSFTTEPYAYPLKNITATASSSSAVEMGPQKTVDGSGLSGDQHGTTSTDMWLSGMGGTGATWIQYAFDKAYKLQQMLVWNSNQLMESFVGFGARNVTVEYSADGSTWKTLGDFEFARAPAAAGYTANTTVDFAGVMAKYVKLTMKSNWGGFTAQYGLSEVRFLYVPVASGGPSPAPGAMDVAPQVTLSWRPGREAGSHQVFLGTDANNLTLAATVQESRYQADVGLGQTYYWKIVEVNEAKDPAAWPSDVWSFSTMKFFVVDDFESYTDDMDKNQAIFQTWLDGYGTKTNGAIVGYGQAPFAETRIILSGKQAMPLFYSNTAGATYSEAERTFDAPQDWTKHGYKGLALSFYGDPNNTGQMYLKINNTKIAYGGKAEDLKRALWQPWNVDLAASGVSLKSITKLTIGVEGAGATGTLYVDDIRLYPTPGEMITPVDPGTTGLAAWYKFDGDFKDSAGTHAATAKGDAKIVSDSVRGQVVTLDGTGDAVAVPLLGSGTALTLAMWVNTAVDPVPIQFESFFHANGWEVGDLHWRYSYGKANAGINSTGFVDLSGVSIAKANQWNHVAVTVSPTEWALWLNGLKEASRALTAPVTVTLGDGLIGAWLGTDGTTISRNFTGKIDDARFYNRALSAEEIAALAGRTAPFYKPQ
jgi:hypothetical protein